VLLIGFIVLLNKNHCLNFNLQSSYDFYARVGKEVFLKKGLLEDETDEILHGEEVVQVDESLFEDLDDLNLDDCEDE